MGKCTINDDDLIAVLDKLLKLEKERDEDLSYWIEMVYQPIGFAITLEQYRETFKT